MNTILDTIDLKKGKIHFRTFPNRDIQFIDQKLETMMSC